MMVRCMTCQHLVIGAPSRTVGCLCDPDASTWLAIDNDERIIGGTYRYYIPMTDASSE
jgi:hypothetical protein